MKKKWRVYFTFDVLSERGRASILWDGEDEFSVIEAVTEHLKGTPVFCDANPIVDKVRIASLEDIREFVESEEE